METLTEKFTHRPTGQLVTAGLNIHSRRVIDGHCHIVWDGRITWPGGAEREVELRTTIAAPQYQDLPTNKLAEWLLTEELGK